MAELPCPDGCEANEDIPGVRWPSETNGDDSHPYVERCDACQRYDSDDDAADALAEHLEESGKTVTRGEAIAPGTINPTPWIEVG